MKSSYEEPNLYNHSFMLVKCIYIFALTLIFDTRKIHKAIVSKTFWWAACSLPPPPPPPSPHPPPTRPHTLYFLRRAACGPPAHYNFFFKRTFILEHQGSSCKMHTHTDTHTHTQTHTCIHAHIHMYVHAINMHPHRELSTLLLSLSLWGLDVKRPWVFSITLVK